MGSTALRDRFLTSAGVLTGAALFERFARLVRNVILARILAPSDFGQMAIVMSALMVLESLSRVGVQQSVIQNKRGADREFMNAAWWFGVAVAVAVFLPGLFSAPAVARFYEQPSLAPMLALAFFCMVMESMTSIRTYALQKELKFVRWVVLIQGSGVVNIVVAIVAGYLMRSVWALVIALVAQFVFKLVLSYILCPFMPSLRIERESARDVMRFAKGMFGLPVLVLIFLQADIFVLGKMTSMSAVGLYSMALGLAQLPYAMYTSGIAPIILPLMSSVQDDPLRFRRNLQSITAGVTYFGLPVVVFLVANGNMLLSLAYGEEYAKAALVFRIMCVSFFIRAVSELLSQAVIAMGKPAHYRTFSTCRAVVMLVLLYPMIKVLGPTGAALSVLLATVSFWALLVQHLRGTGDVGLGAYAAVIGRGVLLSLPVGATALVPFFTGGPTSTMGLLVLAAFSGLICCATWWIALGWLRKGGLAET